MTIGEAVRAQLLASAGVAAAAPDRVYPDTLPQDAVLPAIVYTAISCAVWSQLNGPTGMERARIQVDAIATTRLAADTLGRACQAQLQAAGRGDWSGVTVRSVEIPAGLHGSASEPGDGSDEWGYVATFDALIVYDV
jgi:hypothetical protein